MWMLINTVLFLDITTGIEQCASSHSDPVSVRTDRRQRISLLRDWVPVDVVTWIILIEIISFAQICNDAFFMDLELHITNISYHHHICVPWHNNRHRAICFSHSAQFLSGLIVGQRISTFNLYCIQVIMVVGTIMEYLIMYRSYW